MTKQALLKELAVVIPVYDEAESIKDVIDKWVSVLSDIGVSYTILAINDGSKDKSGVILDELAKEYNQVAAIHKPNEGHGKTILKGYRLAVEEDYAFIFQTDSDDQFHPEDFRKLWAERNSFDFILGYRQDRDDPFLRLVISRILRALVFFLWGANIKDANCPYRLMRTEFMKELVGLIPLETFAPNILFSVAARLKRKKRFLEVGVRHRKRRAGVCSIRNLSLAKGVMRSFSELACFRLRRNP